MFPPDQNLQDLIRSPNASEAELFPPDKPYKLLYSLNAMQACLEDVVLAPAVDQGFISQSVRLLVSVLTKPQPSEIPAHPQLWFNIATNTVQCLFLALKAKVSTETSKTYFSTPSGLVHKLLEGMRIAHESRSQQSEGLPICSLLRNSFAVLLEASLHDERVLASLQEQHDLGKFLLVLLLDEDRADFRQAAMEVITRISGPAPSSKIMTKVHSAQPSTLEQHADRARRLLMSLWINLLPNFARASEKPAASEELFTVALAVLQALARTSIEGLDLEVYLRNWGVLLVDHKHKEVRQRLSFQLLLLLTKI